MPREPVRLKLGKGAAFVKSQIRYLPQEDDTWEADFLPLPYFGAQDHGTCRGMVISHAHQYLLAQRTGEELPTINDLADLLAQAMQRPMTGIGHLPQCLYMRSRQDWAEFLPHLKQIGIEVFSHEALPKWDQTFEDVLAKVDQVRSAQKAAWRRRQLLGNQQKNQPMRRRKQ